MRIHTLGPAATDSSQAAQYYVEHYLADQLKTSTQIVLHSSFEQLFSQLQQLKDDFLVIPTAFRSAKSGMSWGQWHYRNLTVLDLQTAFVYPLNSLVLLENTASVSNIAYTHAALTDLMGQYIKPKVVRCSASKYAAYQQYLVDGQYVLTNEKNVRLRPTEKILQRFSPQMVWAVYQIKEFQK